MIKNGLEDRARIIERETDAEREQAWKEQDLSHPCAWIKLALGTDVKGRY